MPHRFQSRAEREKHHAVTCDGERADECSENSEARDGGSDKTSDERDDGRKIDAEKIMESKWTDSVNKEQGEKHHSVKTRSMDAERVEGSEKISEQRDGGRIKIEAAKNTDGLRLMQSESIDSVRLALNATTKSDQEREEVRESNGKRQPTLRETRRQPIRNVRTQPK